MAVTRTSPARLTHAWLEQNPAWGDPVQRDLLLHLVISHHGMGRPLVPPVADGTPTVVSGVLAGVSLRHRLTLASSTGISRPALDGSTNASGRGDWRYLRPS